MIFKIYTHTSTKGQHLISCFCFFLFWHVPLSAGVQGTALCLKPASQDAKFASPVAEFNLR